MSRHRLSRSGQGTTHGDIANRATKRVAAALTAATLIGQALASSTAANAATFSFDGKCAFLLDSSYQETCTALFSDDVLTLMPKGSRQVRILPQQVVYIALADKSTMKANEGVALYNKAVPWWQPWNKIPGWVKNATNEKAEAHQFTIGYVDSNFNPKIALFVLNDKGKAGAMASELQAASGLALGETRRADRALDARLVGRLSKDVQRQAQRLTGMCSSWMFEDAQPVADALNTFVKNTTEEISIFDGADAVSKKLTATANSAFTYCDGQIKAEIAQAEAEERARLEAIRRRQVAERNARAQAAIAAVAQRNQAVAAARAARRSAWDSLAGS
ncbi:MAG: hypothetical protein ACKO0M_09720 [Cyanobium sp.]